MGGKTLRIPNTITPKSSEGSYSYPPPWSTPPLHQQLIASPLPILSHSLQLHNSLLKSMLQPLTSLDEACYTFWKPFPSQIGPKHKAKHSWMKLRSTDLRPR